MSRGQRLYFYREQQTLFGSKLKTHDSRNNLNVPDLMQHQLSNECYHRGSGLTDHKQRDLLKDCLDACALYSFQTPSDNFPSLGCSGVTWNKNDIVPDCWLKRSMNLLLSDPESGIDAGVLIMPNT